MGFGREAVVEHTRVDGAAKFFGAVIRLFEERRQLTLRNFGRNNKEEKLRFATSYEFAHKHQWHYFYNRFGHLSAIEIEFVAGFLIKLTKNLAFGIFFEFVARKNVAFRGFDHAADCAEKVVINAGLLAARA